MIYPSGLGRYEETEPEMEDLGGGVYRLNNAYEGKYYYFKDRPTPIIAEDEDQPDTQSQRSQGEQVGQSLPNQRSKIRKRIALFTGAYNHVADGVSLVLNRLVAHLEDHGAAVRIFAPTVENPPVDHAGTLVPVRSVPALGRPEHRVAMGLSRANRRALKAFRPNLFHVATPELLGRSARRLARRWSVPLVASYHTHFSSYLKYYGLGLLGSALWAYLRRFYRPCRHVYVPSPSMAEVLRYHGITSGLRLWQRGVNTTRFNPDQRSLKWRRAHGIDDEKVVVTFVSRLVREKGLDLFAEVIEGLRARDVPHRCLVVGDGPARADLQRRLPSAVFTGYLGGNALARAYASSDVFLFPSDTETFGNVTLEAMASGLPTVCADATGSSTLVDNERTGLLAPSSNTNAFLDATTRLIRHTDLRHQMGQAARERAERYDWETTLARMAGYYDEILNPQHPAPESRHELALGEHEIPNHDLLRKISEDITYSNLSEIYEKEELIEISSEESLKELGILQGHV